MEEHAGELVKVLDQLADITVLTWPDLDKPLAHGRILNRLTGHLRQDAAIMNAQHVECWLTMSAPLTALAPYVDAPVYGYVHGSDALMPWMPHNNVLAGADRLLGRMRIPFKTTPSWRRQRIKKGLEAARLVFANSRYTAKIVTEIAPVPPSKVHVVHPGVSADYLAVERGSNGSELRLLTIARLQPAARRKNVDGLIEAMALLRDELPAILTVIGDGDDLPRLRALADAKGLGDRVRFTGDASRAEIGRHLARTDVFILAVRPTTVDVEGYGMVYVEAACAGVPSIAVATGGVNDAIKDGRTGILLNGASPTDIAGGIRRFVRTRQLFREDDIRAFGRDRTATRTTERLWSLIKQDAES